MSVPLFRRRVAKREKIGPGRWRVTLAPCGHQFVQNRRRGGFLSCLQCVDDDRNGKAVAP